jgi:uncharacterized membrane protein YfcA
MHVAELTLYVFAGSLFAGFTGSLSGLGGGVVLVPFLTLACGVDMRYAIGTSLVSVIATSSGAAAAYVKEGYANIRAGMFLETATILGATFGAFLTTRVHTGSLAIFFGSVLLFSILPIRLSRGGPEPAADRLSARLRFDSSYPADSGPSQYHVRRIPLGYFLMLIAGAISGLLGIGSGAFKVLAMDRAMKFPFKVSTTTSNFMIGVTAAAGAGTYLREGYIDPGLCMPAMLGVLIGAAAGSRVLMGTGTKALRLAFNIIILALGLEMIYQGLAGRM